jgi:protein-arginine kinase
MINPHGSVTLNGVTDKELVKLLEIKMGHESSLSFNPSLMQVQNVPQPGPAGNVAQVYNNVVLGWANDNGLEALRNIVNMLISKEEKVKAVGQ